MNIYKIKNIFSKIKNIVNYEINLMDESGYIIESTDKEKIGFYDKNIEHGNCENKIFQLNNYTYYFFYSTDGEKIFFSIEGITMEIIKLAEIINVFLSENFNDLTENEILRNLLLGNLKGIELCHLNKKLNIPDKIKMRVITIEAKANIIREIENLVCQIYPNEIFTKINNNFFCFIEKCPQATKPYYIELRDAIYSELLYEPKIGVGTIVENIYTLCISYKKSIEAITLGNLFFKDKNIYLYKDLGIPKLIYNMDKTLLDELCQNMNYINIQKVLSDKELVLTAFKFFENNLNISVTSKKLFVHRNTLIYRLNKIYKISGYDLRNFEDAVNFKIVLLIHNYIKSNENIRDSS